MMFGRFYETYKASDQHAEFVTRSVTKRNQKSSKNYEPSEKSIFLPNFSRTPPT